MAGSEQQISIKIRNLSKSYRLYNKPVDRVIETFHPSGKTRHKLFHAVNNISFDIYKGETIGILGKNGAGKSTLLKMITGVLTPTSGTIEVEGKISALLELGAGFNPDLSGLENVYFNGAIMGYTNEEMDSKVQSIINFADIGDFINQPVKNYSSGMFARLAFAVAVNVDPDILIVDEALSVGDVAFQTKCFRKFSEFQNAGKTIIFVSHSLDSILKYCSRAVVINDGELVAQGKTREMVDVFKRILVNLYDIEDDLKVNKETYEESVQGRWKQYFPVNNAVLEYGNKAVEIIDFGIFDEKGQPTSKILSDEVMEFRMKLHFQEKIDEPIFAFTIKDLKGHELAGTNTWFQDVPTGSFAPGDTVVINFKQKLLLQNGVYTLSLGCTGYQLDELVVYHRLYDILSFEVHSVNKIVGIYDLLSTIELEV
ncbi:ABC transporter ATP-binding protein [Paenibacillus chitinolyticus]|uniref:ABC transporter ATP-binding protein n=1 Tax=Paenibacillus chitinolyticus TaxID=79263 RepID=UPI003D070A45